MGASLAPRAEALEGLRAQLFVGGPIALLLASVAGYVLAAAALRPVERMGERAATISAASSARRLPVPAADDEISRLGRRLNDMLARLEAALERERALVANASHELRTPLALLKTEIELALDEPDSAPALAAALRSVGAETDRLAQLADDLLLLAHVDAGELPLRRGPVAITELLESIATRFRRRAPMPGARSKSRCPRAWSPSSTGVESSKRSPTSSKTRFGTAQASCCSKQSRFQRQSCCTSGTKAKDSRPSSSSAPSSGSAGLMDQRAAPASASRSWPRSRTLTAAPRQPRTDRVEAPTSR